MPTLTEDYGKKKISSHTVIRPYRTHASGRKSALLLSLAELWRFLPTGKKNIFAMLFHTPDKWIFLTRREQQVPTRISGSSFNLVLELFLCSFPPIFLFFLYLNVKCYFNTLEMISLPSPELKEPSDFFTVYLTYLHTVTSAVKCGSKIPVYNSWSYFWDGL